MKINGVWPREILRDAEGGGGGGGGEDAAAAATAADTSHVGTWRENLAEDLRGHKALSPHADVEALAREHVNAQALIGAKGAIVPKDDAGEDDWNKFYGELGRPETAGDYAFKADEKSTVDPALDKWFREAAHAEGLSEKQAAGVFHSWNEKITELNAVDAEAAAKTEKFAKETLAGLKTEWGPDYEPKMALAQRGTRAAFGESLDAALAIKTSDDELLLDTPIFARAMAAIGAAFSEDSNLPGAGEKNNTGGLSVEAALVEIETYRAEIKADPNHPYNAGKGKDYFAAQRKMADLAAQAYPEGKAA